jgi:hypothetical protein
MAKDAKQVTAALPEGTDYDDEGRIVSAPIPPELIEQIRAQQAEAGRQRRIIDRVNNIRDGLIQPPWMKDAAKSRGRKPLGWQVRKIIPILRELYSPTGIPPAGVKPKEYRARIAKVLGKEGPDLRDSIARAVEAIKRGDA